MLVIDDLSVRIAGKLLIEEASVRIPTGARVGLVGRNGCGKSTLFSVITGHLEPEQGRIEMPQRFSVGHLAQEAPNGPDSLIEVVLRADHERNSLLTEAETAQDPNRIADIQMRLADIGAHAAPARAAAILAGLGFSESQQQRPCAEFSGGWRMRVGLAATLFAEPDLLLLDEPTNYLDLEGTLWLQEHLARYPRTFIIISHDRDLLDTAVSEILHLERGKLTFYRGTYSSFARQRQERLILDAKLVKKQEAQRKHLQAFVDRFRAKATKARQAQSRLKLLAKLEPITALMTQDVRPIVIPPPARPLSPPIVAIDRVAVGYEPKKPILQRLTLRIDPDDRIALIGSNGNGKSTLVKLIAGRLTPAEGSIVRADRLNVAYFAQHQVDELDPAESAYQHLRRLMPDAAEAKVRTRLGSLGFSADMADQPVATLSGGEKARLLLGLATMSGPHLVMLDEPTNHLDIDSRAALVEAINDFPGAVILVSHDRHLLEACADRLWLVANGTVTPYDGDLDDYRRRVLSDRGGGAKSSDGDRKAEARAGQQRAAAPRRAELSPLRKRIKSAETDVARLGAAIAEIDAKLADPLLFSRDPREAARLAKTRSDAAASLAKAEDDWLEASAAYDTASTSAGGQ